MINQTQHFILITSKMWRITMNIVFNLPNNDYRISKNFLRLLTPKSMHFLKPWMKASYSVVL